MEILRNVKQINDKLNLLLSKENAFGDNDNSFIYEMLPDDYIRELVVGAEDMSEKKVIIESISQLIFQLKNYMFALCNLTKIFLFSKNYNCVFNFTSRLFVAHIGNIVYNSNQGPYNYTERYFDRFIEIVKNCEIKYEDYLPLILDIFKTDKLDGISLWKAPAVEYLQDFFNKNEDWSIKYLKNNIEKKYDLLKAITEFNTPKGLKLILDDYVVGVNVDKIQAMHIFKKYKRDALFLLDKEITECEDKETRYALVDILLNFDSDTEVNTRLQELYRREKNEEIKDMIAKKIGITETLSIKTEKQYMLAVRKNITEPQERSLGVPFEHLKLRYVSEYESDNAGKSFLIYLFKEEKDLEKLPKLNMLKKIFIEQELSDFAYELFKTLMKKQDINQAKWCIRMCCLYSEDKSDELIAFMKTLFLENRVKEAKYLTECLIASGRKNVLETVQQLVNDGNEGAKANVEAFAELSAKVNSTEKNEIYDMLVPENYTPEDYEKQKARLYNGFIAGRVVMPQHFEKTFMGKKLFIELCKGLVFGEYVAGRLHNCFVLENNEKKYIMGKEIEDKDKMISIVHSLDLDFRSSYVKDYIKNPTFEQFTLSRFNVAEFSRSSISVNRFCGMFVNLTAFSNNLKRKGFIVNKAYDEIEYNSFIHVMNELNLISEVMLEKPAIEGQTTATIGMVHFLRFEDVMLDKGKYITAKENSVSVGALPDRYFDFVLNAIYESAQTDTTKTN